jgi:hypothetical protein
MGIFTDLLRKDAVWAKGRIIPNYDPAIWRWDSNGGVMRYSEYGQTTEYGWEIDHIDPNGSDDLANLQPLNWLNNRRKSDKTPSIFDLFIGGIKR